MIQRPPIKRGVIINFSKKDIEDQKALLYIRAHRKTPEPPETWNNRYNRWMDYWRSRCEKYYFGNDVIPFNHPHLRDWIEHWRRIGGEVKLFCYRDETSDPEDFKSCSDLIDVFTYWFTEEKIMNDRDKINRILTNL